MRTIAFNKYVWLIDLLKTPHTLREIADAWDRCPLNDSERELNRSTFFYWKGVIENTYGVDVETRLMGRHTTYVIESAPGKDRSRDWLLNTASIENTLMANLDIRERVVLEPVPSSGHYLQTFLEAMHQDRCVSFDYHDYWEDPVSITVQPYFVKLFRQHWKVIGPLEGNGYESIRSYALDQDRMRNVRITDVKFRYPDDFYPETFMENSLGTMTFPTKKAQPKNIVILAWEKVNLYLKAVPLHSSQTLLHDVEEDGYSIFRYTLHPTDDFYQELCRYQEYVEVLSPPEVRREMKAIIKRMQDEYDGVSRATCVSNDRPFEKYLIEE